MHPSFRELVGTFFKIGCLGFGGPAGQIALMHRIIVDEKRWVDEKQYLGALNFCMLLPGPEAQQLATWIGWKLHGVRGGLASGLLFILPGFVLITAIAAIYASFGKLPMVEALFYGLKAAVLALVVEALLRISKRALKDNFAYVVAALAFVALFIFAIPFPLVVLAALIAGFLRGQDNTTPPIAVAATGPARGLVTILSGLAVWAALPLLMALMFGPATIFIYLAKFFSTTAVVTFGGAYAVLAYVAQAAVETRHWLTAPEMLDALAMAETTPGPLILVLVFVGYLAGYRAPDPLSALAGGLLGATTTLWVTFAPSFLFIFVGAPYLERLTAIPRLKTALAAVTAAVVGVILNLSLWFALHVIFGKVDRINAGPVSMIMPDIGSIDWLALGLVTLSFVLLFRLHAGLARTLIISALIGGALRYGLQLAG